MSSLTFSRKVPSIGDRFRLRCVKLAHGIGWLSFVDQKLVIACIANMEARIKLAELRREMDSEIRSPFLEQMKEALEGQVKLSLSLRLNDSLKRGA